MNVEERVKNICYFLSGFIKPVFDKIYVHVYNNVINDTNIYNAFLSLYYEYPSCKYIESIKDKVYNFPSYLPISYGGDRYTKYELIDVNEENVSRLVESFYQHNDIEFAYTQALIYALHTYERISTDFTHAEFINALKKSVISYSFLRRLHSNCDKEVIIQRVVDIMFDNKFKPVGACRIDKHLSCHIKYNTRIQYDTTEKVLLLLDIIKNNPSIQIESIELIEEYEQRSKELL